MMFTKSLTFVGWIRTLAWTAAVGSLLLFPSAGTVLRLDKVGLSGPWQLIIAGVVVFPTFYLSDALGSGLMHQHVLPEGSLLDGNHAQLWFNLTQGTGRFL